MTAGPRGPRQGGTTVPPGCFAAFIGVFYLAGFGLLGYGLVNARRSTPAANWPTAPGVLTHVELYDHPDAGGAGTTEVRVRYTYTVDGVAYAGDRVAFGYSASTGQEAHGDIHRKLKGAKAVDVRYDPENPGVSCLSYGVHRSILIVLGFAAVWLTFVLGVTALCWVFSRPDTVLLDNLAVR